MKRILIIGATSAMAKGCARAMAEQGHSLFLCARKMAEIEELKHDLLARGAGSVSAMTLDINNLSRHKAVLETAYQELDGLDLVLLAHGTLPNQQQCEQNVDKTIEALQTNAVSSIAFLTRVANQFEQWGQGTIAAISSVAGDRGRQSNYVYGAAKNCLTTYLQGLRNRLDKAGVRVVTIKPGLVISPMTADFEKGPLWASADDVGRRMARVLLEGKQDVVYLPGFWRWIMMAICMIPETIFKRMSLG
ncbi:SDR family oxidoreductase [Spongorhabdus nitratireducens]